MTEKAVEMHSTPNTAAEYEAAIDQCLERMHRLREQIDRDQAEIDRLRAQTQTKLAELAGN
jgi:hypothetical protein